MLDVLPNLYRPGEGCDDGPVPLRLRVDTDDIDALRPRETGWKTGALALVLSCRERLLTDGERFLDRPDAAETTDMASESLPARSDGGGESVCDSIGEVDIAADAVERGERPGLFRTRVVSSRPLKASSNRRPSASRSSIS